MSKCYQLNMNVNIVNEIYHDINYTFFVKNVNIHKYIFKNRIIRLIARDIVYTNGN